MGGKQGGKMAGGDVEENKGLAAIGYLWILFLVPLLAKKDSAFAQFHGKQGMILFIAEVIWIFAGMFLFHIPILGWIIGSVGWFILFVLFVIGLMNALGGKTQPLPVIGQFAGKVNV